jgi:hypothetical protein
MSPRGLISILLFLQIKEVRFIDASSSIINEQVLLVVILTSMLMMTLGTMKKSGQDSDQEISEDSEATETNSLDVFLDEIATKKEDLN